MRRLHPVLAVLAPLALAACSRGDPEARARVFAPGEAARTAPAPTFDPAHPEAALALGPDAVARGLGSFEWSGAVAWTVSRDGDDAIRVHADERHAVRQSAAGEFEVQAEIDPGLGPGSVTGKQVIWTGGMTYARALPAAFRERPTDRGRDARRFRDESFGMAAALARLYGPALRLEPAGDAQALGRPARRYRLVLAQAAPPAAPAPAKGASADPDTKLRRAFLEGRVPLAADGELIADAATGAPLRVHLTGTFGVKDQPGVTAAVELLAQVQALGAQVAPIAAPKDALPDERKPAGPSTALEAAGLKKRGADRAGGEPSDEPEQ
jgi:hypothetical protein